MVAVAFILINTTTGKEREVLEQLLKMNNVKEGWTIYGDYDIIIRVECSDFNELEDKVIFQVRCMENVTKTTTMLAV